MPSKTKNKFQPGKHLHTEDEITCKILQFQKLQTLVNANIFKKPIYQGALNKQKVNEMIESYLNNPKNFQYKNKIVIGVINKQYYIIDGQHRVEMICNLCKINKFYNKKTVIVAYYMLDNHEEALELFSEINIDSCKNKFYISLDCFSKVIINDFRQLLKNLYKDFFSSKKTTKKGKIKCIEEFVDELYKINFFENNKKNESLKKLIHYNNLFFDLHYKTHIEDESLEKLIYKTESKSIIDNHIVFTTKCNNFINFIKNEGNIKTKHRWKKNKKRIVKGIKDRVWFNYFKNIDCAICPIKHCNNKIYKNSFQAGHIISEYNGGLVIDKNLKPICKDCNLKMGTQNWNEFDICN
tara:strand:+ start:3072 stop:4130 length:1059 start_codon:yes stop_codon:yes gene_type:complete